MNSKIYVTAVGDSVVGKTSLMMRFKDNAYDYIFVPTVFEEYTTYIMVEGVQYTLQLQDTAGSEEYDRLRPLAYPLTNVFIMCCGVNMRDSYDNMLIKWYPEVKHYNPNAIRILAITKSDLKSIPNTITVNEARNLQRKIGAVALVYCSSKTGENVTHLFQTAVKQSCVARQPRKRLCSIL